MASYHEIDLYYNCRTKQLCITTTQWSEICKTKPRSVEFLGAYEIDSAIRGDKALSTRNFKNHQRREVPAREPGRHWTAVTAGRNTIARLIDDVYAGRLHPGLAAGLPLLNLQLRAIEKTDLEQRVAQLENKLAEDSSNGRAQDPDARSILYPKATRRMPANMANNSANHSLGQLKRS